MSDLAAGCLVLVGFVSLFVVFRYQSIDASVDARKAILREILSDAIKEDPVIHTRIQAVGKNGDFARDFAMLIDSVPTARHSSSYLEKVKEAVWGLVKEIHECRRTRAWIIWPGWALILVLGAAATHFTAADHQPDSSVTALLICASTVFVLIAMVLRLGARSRSTALTSGARVSDSDHQGGENESLRDSPRPAGPDRGDHA